ncbi:hypothetical protein ACFJGW_19295 [Burkholderiaceae bacterium UC74_6]
MKSKPNDALVGLLVVTALVLMTWCTLGFRTLLWLISLFLFGALILYLWSSKSVGVRMLAVVLMPAILLVYLIPKDTRRAMQDGATDRSGDQ